MEVTGTSHDVLIIGASGIVKEVKERFDAGMFVVFVIPLGAIAILLIVEPVMLEGEIEAVFGDVVTFWFTGSGVFTVFSDGTEQVSMVS
jgi:hypothetical protein